MIEVCHPHSLCVVCMSEYVYVCIIMKFCISYKSVIISTTLSPFCDIIVNPSVVMQRQFIRLRANRPPGAKTPPPLTLTHICMKAYTHAHARGFFIYYPQLSSSLRDWNLQSNFVFVRRGNLAFCHCQSWLNKKICNNLTAPPAAE